jgi:4-diphosphocytidyl-2-C-methyl-D-erythritol kinase
MPSVSLPAFAKINLRLHILGRRPDGYHELRTIFQAISLHDTLELESQRGSRIDLTIEGNDGLAAERSRDNLVYRALAAARKELGLRHGVRARLLKRIPVGRGLGGGSSDAAAALNGLAALAKKRIAPARMIQIGSRLGADVPFFLFGGQALGVGRGDEIYPLPDGPRRTVLVVSPQDIAVRTADAYGWLRARLTKRPSASTLSSFCALCWSTQGGGTWNDFESVVFPRHSRLKSIKRDLLKSGAVEASLAGSGSAVFALFRSPAQARRAAQAFPHDQIFICETLSRGEYCRAQRGRGGAGIHSRRRR